jgi:hypothetical protein
VLHGCDSNAEDLNKNFIETVENMLKMENQGKEIIPSVKVLKSQTPSASQNYYNGYFIDSITGKQLALVDRTILNLMKTSNMEILLSNDLKSFLTLVSRMDPVNIFNCVEVFNWLRGETKMKWDCNKPTRLNQDNQREDDLKRFREIGTYLIKNKLFEENMKPNTQRSPIALLMSNSVNSNNTSTNFIGGIYCRVESQWRQKN